MDKSSKFDNVPMEEQVRAWDQWNAAAREHKISPTSARQADAVEALVAKLGRNDLNMIDLGCGTGWLCDRLRKYGKVTGIDLSDQVIERARARMPDVRFFSGDLFAIDLPLGTFDVVVTLEVLSHVKDQPAFIERIARLLKPSGQLIIATQNRPVLERWSDVGGPTHGQIRHWVDANGLRKLLKAQFEDIDIGSMFPVGDQGFLRIVNSHKLNALVSTIVPREALERLKERAMLGHTLFARASRVSAR